MANPLSFAFGGDTGQSYDELQRRRKFAEALLAQGLKGGSKTGIEGASNAARSIFGALIAKKAGQQDDANRSAFDTQKQSALASLFGGRAGMSQGGDYAAAQPASPPTEADRIGDSAMAALVKAGLTTRGLPEHVADAFVMNFQDESGLNPSINEKNPTVPGSRGGYGLAQWTGPRRVALEQFAAGQGKPASDLDVQLDFLKAELQGPESAAAKSILSAPDVGTAAQAIVNNFLRPAEAHRASRAAEYAGASGQDIPELMGIMSNPYATESDRAVLGMLLQQKIQAMQPPDPMDALEMRKAELEIQRMENPQVEAPASFAALDLQAQAAGFVPGTPEYKEFMMNGGGSGLPAAFIALDMQAQAAGFVPGTAEYKDFMATRGSGLQAQASAEGKAAGEATASAATQISNGEIALQGIGEIRNHPGIDRGTGLSSLGNSVFGTKGYAFQARVNQLAGGAFLTAIQQLQGMGALSNAEGQTATAALARLQTGLSREEFDDALNDYETIVKNGMDRAQGRLDKKATTPAKKQPMTVNGYTIEEAD